MGFKSTNLTNTIEKILRNYPQKSYANRLNKEVFGNMINDKCTKNINTPKRYKSVKEQNK